MLQPGISFALTSPEVPNETCLFPVEKTYYLFALLKEPHRSKCFFQLQGAYNIFN